MESAEEVGSPAITPILRDFWRFLLPAFLHATKVLRFLVLTSKFHHSIYSDKILVITESRAQQSELVSDLIQSAKSLRISVPPLMWTDRIAALVQNNGRAEVLEFFPPFSFDSRGSPQLSDVLKSKKSLCSLIISDCRLSAAAADSICVALVGSSSLARLEMPSNDFRDGTVPGLILLLQTCHELRTLNLEKTPVRPGFSYDLVAEALKSTSLASLSLMLPRDEGVYAALADSLGSNSVLNALSISAVEGGLGSYHNDFWTKLSSALISGTGCKGLSSLVLVGTPISTQHTFLLTSALKSNICPLTSIEIEVPGSWIAEYWGECLRMNTTITKLSLSSTASCDCSAIADALAVNTSLTSFSRSCGALDREEATVWGSTLPRTRTLKALALENASLSPSSMLLIVVGLSENISITNLSLYNNPWLREEGFAYLGSALMAHYALQKLNLNYCIRANESIGTLLSAAQGCHTLRELSLDSSTLSSRECENIARFLKSNSYIAQLSLDQCSIGTLSAVAIAESLYENHALTRLSLAHNFIGNQGAMAFVELLKVNPTLQSLDLNQMKFDAQTRAALSEAAQIAAVQVSMEYRV